MRAKTSLRKALLLQIGLLILLIITLLSIISLISLRSAFSGSIKSAENGFDNDIKTAVETVVSSLDANHRLFLEGVITHDQEMLAAAKIVRDARYNDDIGYFWADMADGLCAVHLNPDYEGTMRYDNEDLEGNYYIRRFIELGNQGGGYSDFYFTKPGYEGIFKKRGYTLLYEPYGWYISTGNYYDDTDIIINSLRSQGNITYIALLGSGILVALLGLIMLSRQISKVTRPIRNVSEKIAALAVGDVENAVCENSARTDEIGLLQNSISLLSQTMIRQSQVIEIIADGDLTVQYQPYSERDVLGNSIKKLLEINNRAFREVLSATTQVSALAMEALNGSQTLAHDSSTQAANIDAIYHTVSTVLSQTKDNAASANNALESVKTAKTFIDESVEQMVTMRDTMSRISRSSNDIAQIIKVIDDIAFQTNILALNAAVEAARAGQHGKGFAVVADEVRNLASKSADAAKETARLISESVGCVQGGNVTVEKASDSMKKVVSCSQEAYAVIEEINAASKSQEAAISEINESIAQISCIVQSNGASSEESAAISQSLSYQVKTLQGAVKRFRLAR